MGLVLVSGLSSTWYEIACGGLKAETMYEVEGGFIGRRKGWKTRSVAGC